MQTLEQLYKDRYQINTDVIAFAREYKAAAVEVADSVADSGEASAEMLGDYRIAKESYNTAREKRDVIDQWIVAAIRNRNPA